MLTWPRKPVFSSQLNPRLKVRNYLETIRSEMRLLDPRNKPSYSHQISLYYNYWYYIEAIRLTFSFRGVSYLLIHTVYCVLHHIPWPVLLDKHFRQTNVPTMKNTVCSSLELSESSHLILCIVQHLSNCWLNILN